MIIDPVNIECSLDAWGKSAPAFNDAAAETPVVRTVSMAAANDYAGVSKPGVLGWNK